MRKGKRGVRRGRGVQWKIRALRVIPQKMREREREREREWERKRAEQEWGGGCRVGLGWGLGG